MLCSLASKLGDKELGEIEALEKDLGVTVLAFSCKAIDPATVSEDQLTRIREVEDKLGVALVAVAA
jgi:hypothetical protein